MARTNMYWKYFFNKKINYLLRLLANGRMGSAESHHVTWDCMHPSLMWSWVSCNAGAVRSMHQVWIWFNTYECLSAQYGNKSQVCCLKTCKTICLGFQIDLLLLSDCQMPINLNQICCMEQAMGFEDTLVQSVNQTTRISLFKQLWWCHSLSSGTGRKTNRNQVFLLSLRWTYQLERRS